MPRLREAPSAEATATVLRLKQPKRAVAAVERRLAQLEADRDRLLRSAVACEQAIDVLPNGAARQHLRVRATALMEDLTAIGRLRGCLDDT
jgi:hypothetical protein